MIRTGFSSTRVLPLNAFFLVTLLSIPSHGLIVVFYLCSFLRKTRIHHAIPCHHVLSLSVRLPFDPRQCLATGTAGISVSAGIASALAGQRQLVGWFFSVKSHGTTTEKEQKHVFEEK